MKRQRILEKVCLDQDKKFFYKICSYLNDRSHPYLLKARLSLRKSQLELYLKLTVAIDTFFPFKNAYLHHFFEKNFWSQSPTVIDDRFAVISVPTIN